MLDNGQETCNCPKTRCENHGRCGPCKERHARKGGLAFCQRHSEGARELKAELRAARREERREERRAERAQRGAERRS